MEEVVEIPQTERSLPEKQLDGIATIQELSESTGFKAYNWGGWIPDILNNEISRIHDDLDIFLIPRPGVAPSIDGLVSALTEQGWNRHSERGGEVKVQKGEVLAGLIPLKQEGDYIVMEPPDRPLRIEFPKAWFLEEPIVFQGKPINVTDVRLNYCMKVMPAIMNPENPVRPKDTADAEKLRKILLEQGENPDEVLNQIKWINTKTV